MGKRSASIFGGRMPALLQQERSECGVACLAMVCAWWGNHQALPALRRMAGESARGATLADLVRLGGSVGFVTRPVRVRLREIARLPMPAILHWRMNHFVVLARVRRNKVLIHDPARGRRWVSPCELDESFTGVALELRPRREFRSGGGAREPGLRDVFRGVRNIRHFLVLLAIIVIASQVLSLAPAIATQLLIDELILGQAGHWLTSVLVGLGAALACGVLIDALRAWVGLYSGTRLAIDSTLSFVSRLLRMPAGFIRARNLGDLMSRLDSLTPLRTAITEQAADTLGNVVLVVATVAVMIMYDLALATVSLIGLAASSLIMAATLPAERRLAERALVQRAAEKNSLLETFRAFDTVCSLGLSDARDSHWQNRFFGATGTTFRAGKLAILRSTLTAVVAAVEQLTFLGVGVGAVIEQKVSVGALFAFVSLRGRFSGAALQLIGAARQFGLLRVHIRRLSDVVSGESARSNMPGALNRPVRGTIDVSGLAFGYANEPTLFRDLNFGVRAGEHVVITGPSGCGKTTLLRILAGQLEPVTGNVRLDGVELSLWSRHAVTCQTGVVLQDEHLFQGSIADNIAAFDPEVDLAMVREAAHIAGIWEDILRLPMKLQTLLGDTGSTLSGGQVQRIALARAVYRKPRVLYLDEATSHLDVECERRVLGNLRGLGITTISVAHRPAAVSGAGQVIRLGPAN